MTSRNHQELINTITGVHEQLRRSLYLTGDLDKVWNEHVADVELRKKYSKDMHRLATKIWAGNETRLYWTNEFCQYYFQGGGVEQSILRELKIKHQWTPEHTEQLSILRQLACATNNYKNFSIKYKRLKLLDVGSCYNPLGPLSYFDCVAIDLTPANEYVLEYDFLKVEVSDSTNEVPEGQIDHFIAESYDVVLFSLVLEYLPGKVQRVEFCCKAWQLLQRNGLLIIITPDSKSENHNVPMMKSWKSVLEKIGFVRVKYNKLQHIHCMAYRKVVRPQNHKLEMEALTELFFIPQDFKQYKEEKSPPAERTDNENYSILQQFSELPNE